MRVPDLDDPRTALFVELDDRDDAHLCRGHRGAAFGLCARDPPKTRSGHHIERSRRHDPRAHHLVDHASEPVARDLSWRSILVRQSHRDVSTTAALEHRDHAIGADPEVAVGEPADLVDGELDAIL